MDTEQKIACIDFVRGMIAGGGPREDVAYEDIIRGMNEFTDAQINYIIGLIEVTLDTM